MEALKQFLQSWWGYTLIGGVSVGGLITTIIVQFLIWGKTKLNGTKYENAVNKLDEYVSTLELYKQALKKADEEKEKLKTYYENKDNYFKVKEQYFEDVQAVTFKCISYIIMASKLDPEDKNQLFKDISSLSKDKMQSLLISLESDFKDMTKEELPQLVDKIADKVNETVNSSQSILDKYL